ncbi:MAG: type I DNA topoisomerase [Anaerolineales bacterium]
METYCVRCKQKREMSEAVAVFTATGTPATRGVCPVCGTKLFRMGRTPAHEGLTPPARAEGEVRRPRKVKGNAKSRPSRRSGRLVIVESPAKAKTVGRFLGKGYQVRASIGHVRDLLRSRLSVDVESDFTPEYRVPNEKREVVKALKAEASKAEEIFLATDPDREGEAIAWHLLEAAGIELARSRRVSFHEITKPAIEEAFRHPRSIDMALVNAQQARRVLDRLVGYNLSPLLWAKVRGRLSAGRVQSVAVRLIVDREREIRKFVAREYWTIDAELRKPGRPPDFRARVVGIDGSVPELPSESVVQPVLNDLRVAEFQVTKVRRGTRQRRPLAPFTTSTLQQDASRRLGYTARRTMAIAQQLYEGVDLEGGEAIGLITYMRTDSPQVSTSAQEEARAWIRDHFSPAHLPETPPVYKTRTRGAQEAHEAIRPTSVERTPDLMAPSLSPEQAKLYRLIWNRFLASQMNPAEYDTLTLEIEGRSADHGYALRIAASTLRFAGYLEVYEIKPEEGGESPEAEAEASEAALERLPEVDEGDRLTLVDLHPEQHFTQPPPRYTEASLVRTLEEFGIGRPSTYAPILTTIQARGYVERKQKKLEPTEIGETVNDLLVDHFPEIVDPGFTAMMEEELDEVADGERGWVDVIREFYTPFAVQMKQALENMPEVRAEPEVLDRACPLCGNPLLVRHGRYGKFIGCSTFPACRFTEPWLEKLGVRCPQDGGELVERRTRKGRTFYGCANYPACDFTSWKRPIPEPCPTCGGVLVMENTTQVSCLQCNNRFELNQVRQPEPDLA